jgi:hypothetical protein
VALSRSSRKSRRGVAELEYLEVEQVLKVLEDDSTIHTTQNIQNLKMSFQKFLPFPTKYANVLVPELDSLQNTILSFPNTLRAEATAVSDNDKQSREEIVDTGSSIGSSQRSFNCWT